MPKIRNKNSSSINKSGVLTKTFKSDSKRSQEKFEFFNRELVHSENGNLNLTENTFFNDINTIVFEEINANPTFFIDNRFSNSNNNYKNKILNTPNTYPDSIDVNFKRQINPHRKLYNSLIEDNYLESNTSAFDESESDDVRVIKHNSRLNLLELGERYKILVIGDSNDWSILGGNKNAKVGDIFISNGTKLSNISGSAVEKVDINKKEIKIKFERDIDKPIHLSFSNASNNINDVYVLNDLITGNTAFRNFGGNTCYLDANQKKSVDYLGHIDYDYYQDVNSFTLAPICFSGWKYNTGDIIPGSGVLNLPVEDFGFPFDVKFKPKDNHKIKLNKFIKKPFVIEKVILKANISNWSSSDVDQNEPALNFVNFFILNERGSINTSYLQDSFPNRNIDYHAISMTQTSPTNNYDDMTSLQQKWTRCTTSHNNLGNYYQEGIFKETIDINPSDAKTRELVTNISIGNARDSSILEQFFGDLSYKKGLKSVDIAIGDDISLINNSDYDNCVYRFKDIDIESKIKRYQSNKKLPGFSKFKIYPDKNTDNISNTDFSSIRSLNINDKEKELSYTELAASDVNGQKIDFREDFGNSILHNYLVFPEDSLTFGINLSTNFDPSSNSAKRKSKDVFHINGDIEFILVGHYYQDENKIDISKNRYYENKNIKKVNLDNSLVIDNVDPEIYNQKGTYFDFYSNKIPDEKDFDSSNLDFYSSRKRTHINCLNIPNYSHIKSVKNLDLFIGNFYKIAKKGSVNDWSSVGGSATANINDIFKATAEGGSSYNNCYTYQIIKTGANSYLDQIFGNDFFYYRYKEKESSLYKFIKYYFNRRSFGLPKDKLNHNRYSCYEEINNNYRKVFSVKKIFRKGLFKRKIPGTDTYISRNEDASTAPDANGMLTDAQMFFDDSETVIF